MGRSDYPRRGGDGGSRRPRSTFGPPRDAGVALRGRRSRRGRRSDRWQLPLIITIALFLVVGIIAANVPAKPAPGKVRSVSASVPIITAATRKAIRPTPVFAAYKRLRLRLPVQPSSITGVAFHQASYTDALDMTSLVSVVSASSVERAAIKKRARLAAARTAAATRSATRTVAPAVTIQGWTADGLWTGSAFRLYRSGRSGLADTAADIGAKPGTYVYAPVTGTVMDVKRYKLYGTLSDFEIHISPTENSGVDVVLIHVTDVQVTTGSRVEGGITRIAAVRLISDAISGIQLANYTADAGNHVHMQVNKRKPGMLWDPGTETVSTGTTGQ